MPAALQVEVSARRVTRILLAGYAVLLAGHLTVVIAHIVLHRPLGAMTVLFDMDLESNLPTFFNCMLFFILAALSAMAARTGGQEQKRSWTLLSFIFIFLSIDEGSRIHERFIFWAKRLLASFGEQGDPGLFNFAWVIPYGIASLVLLVILVGFLRRSRPELRNGLLLSGAVYLTGAVVFEMIGGKLAYSLEGPATELATRSLPMVVYAPNEYNQYMSVNYVLLYTIEESLEMLGLIMCIRVMLLHHGREGTRLNVVIPGRSEEHAG